MSKIKTALELIKTPLRLIAPLGSNRLLDWMPDRMFCSLLFKAEMGYKLNLDEPQTFNEKLQWLKIYDHRPEYEDLVDKLKAKKCIGERIGYQHIIPTYGEWDKAEDIPFHELPKRFVLKCNHDQGSVIIVSDKDKLDTESVIKTMAKKLKSSVYYDTREDPYKNIRPKVFAEMFLGDRIIDYKFYCFNGEPKFLYCGQGLTEDHSLRIDFYDLDWNLMPFYRTDYERLGEIPRPKHLDEMLEIAKELSKDIPFVRIDLFEVNDRVFFSEFTLCPASGLMPFVPSEYDRIVGSWLQLPTTGIRKG